MQDLIRVVRDSLQGATNAVQIAIRFFKDLGPCRAFLSGHPLRAMRIGTRSEDCV